MIPLPDPDNHDTEEVLGEASFVPNPDDFDAVDSVLQNEGATAGRELELRSVSGSGLFQPTLGTPTELTPYSIVHDLFDAREFADVLRDHPNFAQQLDEQAKGWPYPRELAMDLYTALYRLVPRHTEHFNSKYSINRVAVDAVMNSKIYEELRNSTTMDVFTSSIGVQALTEEILKNDELAQAAAMIAAATPPKKDDNESEGEYQRRLRDWKDQQRRANQQLRQAINQALQQVRDHLDTIEDALQAFGFSVGSEDTGFFHTNDARDKAALVNAVLANPQLRDIIRFAGRIKRVASEVQRLRITATPAAIHNVKRGNDLSHLLASELWMLSDPELEDLFIYRYFARQLLCYDTTRPVWEGQGPIIVAEDESGSMYGLPDAWAKAVFLALYGVSREQRRDIYFMHFSDTKQLKVEIFLAEEQHSLEKLLKCVTHFFNSGTDFEPWMKKAMQIVGDSQWDKADVIIISDEMGFASDGLLKTWRKTKEEKGFRCYGVLVAPYNTRDGLFSQICDTHAWLRPGGAGDPEQDQTVLEELFAV